MTDKAILLILRRRATEAKVQPHLHRWPGKVRELDRALPHHASLASGDRR